MSLMQKILDEKVRFKLGHGHAPSHVYLGLWDHIETYNDVIDDPDYIFGMDVHRSRIINNGCPLVTDQLLELHDSGFNTPLRLMPVGKRKWVLMDDLVYIGKLGDRICVPRGFITDLASVPRVLWGLIPPFGIDIGAFVVHDWLYHQRGMVLSNSYNQGPFRSNRRIPKIEADGIMRRIAREQGASYWRRWLMYCGVRLAFWNGWEVTV